MKLGIGIDTGGTYTDAVLYDFTSNSILASGKSLTTKQDLTIGILGALDQLPLEQVRQAEMISLSTTLATNACVEDKGGRAKLLFFGGDRKVIQQYGAQYGLPPVEEIYLQDSYTKFSGEILRDPDWDQFRRYLSTDFGDWDGVGIIEMNAMRNGAVVEKKAKEIFQEQHKIPVVCGHELFSELNCLQRGSSTLLNASLFPVIQEFLSAVKKALEVREIRTSELVIVRSDGSLMSEEFAALRPVETLLCGPAASAMGCTRLAGDPNSIVVDMGGTTTDIALVRDGVPVTATDGVSIGRWKTFVDGLYIKTFGLGGDSAVHYHDGDLFLEEFRVIPLCIAASAYPSITENLKKLEPRKHTRFLYEHYLLTRDISDSSRYTEEEKAFCQGLKDGPLPITEAAARIGREIYTLDVKRLVKDGVVQLCGLTPTDIMHLKGDFSKYDQEASRLAAEFAAFNLKISVPELCDRVYDEVKRKLYRNLVAVLLENKYPHYRKHGIHGDIFQFIEESYQAAKSGTPDPLLSSAFHTDYTLVGVGAPIHIFLDDVARMLGTRAVIPEHHQVANALGAIVGNISASASVEVMPDLTSEEGTGFIAFGTGETRHFEKLEEAVVFARSQAESRALEEAKRRGARGQISVTSQANDIEGAAKHGNVYLRTVVTAYAVGSTGFSQ